jgi:hypothetical protein
VNTPTSATPPHPNPHPLPHHPRLWYNTHMYTNGRSTAPRRGYAIRTNDPIRRAKWDRLFGLDALPVVSPWPVEMVQPDGSSGYYYELDTRALTAWQVQRLAGHISARCWGISHTEALARIEQGWFVSAENCELVERSETAVSPVFAFRSGWWGGVVSFA